MNIYEGMVIATFIMSTIMMISQYIDSEVPRVYDILQIMPILGCYELKVYKDDKRLKQQEMVQYINSHVKAYEFKKGVLYIEIY